MEETKTRILHGEYPRKLDLNALLSITRRPQGDNSGNDNNNKPTLSNNTCINDMVPFSWERIPGEPKDKDTNCIKSDSAPILPPKPPPGRPQPPLLLEEANDCSNSACYDADEVKSRGKEQPLDTIDIFSLAESIDDDEEEDFDVVNNKDRRNSYKLECERHPSPSFIIQRFLPDAQALAEASVMSMNKQQQYSFSSPRNSRSRAVSVRRSYRSPPKGCGLGGFFGWKMRPKPCSVKSPVCDTIVEANQKKNR